MQTLVHAAKSRKSEDKIARVVRMIVRDFDGDTNACYAAIVSRKQKLNESGVTENKNRRIEQFVCSQIR